MQKPTITAFLEKLGLSSKETLAYLYCLEHGPQLVTQLGKVTGSTRTNTYDIIKKLEQKGLCHSVGSSYGRKIKANNPEDIKDLLDNKSKEIKDLKSLLTFFSFTKPKIYYFCLPKLNKKWKQIQKKRNQTIKSYLS